MKFEFNTNWLLNKQWLKKNQFVISTGTTGTFSTPNNKVQQWVVFLSSSTVLWLKWLEQKLCGPMEAHCRRAGHLLCFLICQFAPVDYSWLPGRGKLISGGRSLCRSSDQAQEHTQRHPVCTWCAHKTQLYSNATHSTFWSFTKFPFIAKPLLDDAWAAK